MVSRTVVPCAIHLFQEFPDAVFGHDVQANRRLIQEKQRRVVKERGRQVTTHSFSQAELSHRRMEVVFQIEDVAEEIQPPAVVLLGHFVKFFEEFEGFDDRDVPPKLRTLAKYNSDVLRVTPPVAVRHIAARNHLPAAGDQDSCQHLDGGGLARPIRPDVAHHFPGLDGETDMVHGANGQVFAHKEVLERSLHAFATAEGAEFLREVFDFNNRRHE